MTSSEAEPTSVAAISDGRNNSTCWRKSIVVKVVRLPLLVATFCSIYITAKECGLNGVLYSVLPICVLSVVGILIVQQLYQSATWWCCTPKFHTTGRIIEQHQNTTGSGFEIDTEYFVQLQIEVIILDDDSSDEQQHSNQQRIIRKWARYHKPPCLQQTVNVSLSRDLRQAHIPTRLILGIIFVSLSAAAFLYVLYQISYIYWRLPRDNCDVGSTPFYITCILIHINVWLWLIKQATNIPSFPNLDDYEVVEALDDDETVVTVSEDTESMELELAQVDAAKPPMF